jgi:hypothetical protein
MRLVEEATTPSSTPPAPVEQQKGEPFAEAT